MISSSKEGGGAHGDRATGDRRQAIGILKDSVLNELNVGDDSGSSLMLIDGESEWDRVVVEDVDSEEGSDESDGNGMVEFARIDSDCSQLLNVTPLAISNSIGIHVDENLSGLLEDDQSGNQACLSP